MGIKTGIVALAFTAGAATASFDLRISEMWPGNEPGENLTSDWFEVTNFGSSDFTFGVDGFLFFDDNSADVSTADIMTGVLTIAAGESVVFVDDDSAAEFLSVWFPNGDAPQVGIYAGSGLGQGGDGVTLFLGPTDFFADLAGEPDNGIIDFQEYPDAELNGGQSWDVQLGAFSTVGNAAGAFESAVANDEGQFGVASPGSAIPTPGALAMLGLGGLAAIRRRR